METLNLADIISIPKKCTDANSKSTVMVPVLTTWEGRNTDTCDDLTMNIDIVYPNRASNYK